MVRILLTREIVADSIIKPQWYNIANLITVKVIYIYIHTYIQILYLRF